jgi:Fe-S-cluster-containing dehydrogenase component
MCVDRDHNGLLPACVKTCPTGAMNFGDRDEMVSLANKSLSEVRKKSPKVILSVIEDTREFKRPKLHADKKKFGEKPGQVIPERMSEEAQVPQDVLERGR